MQVNSTAIPHHSPCKNVCVWRIDRKRTQVDAVDSYCRMCGTVCADAHRQSESPGPSNHCFQARLHVCVHVLDQCRNHHSVGDCCNVSDLLETRFYEFVEFLNTISHRRVLASNFHADVACYNSFKVSCIVGNTR